MPATNGFDYFRGGEPLSLMTGTATTGGFDYFRGGEPFPAVTEPVVVAPALTLYNQAKRELADGTIVWGTTALKVMLVGSGYSPNPDHLTVDDGTASDPASHEISVSGYAAGWGGTGRRSVSSMGTGANHTADQGELTGQVGPWTALTLPAGAAALLIREGASDDTTSRLIAYYPIATPPATSNWQLAWSGQVMVKLT